MLQKHVLDAGTVLQRVCNVRYRCSPIMGGVPSEYSIRFFCDLEPEKTSQLPRLTTDLCKLAERPFKPLAAAPARKQNYLIIPDSPGVSVIQRACMCMCRYYLSVFHRCLPVIQRACVSVLPGYNIKELYRRLLFTCWKNFKH